MWIIVALLLAYLLIPVVAVYSIDFILRNSRRKIKRNIKSSPGRWGLEFCEEYIYLDGESRLQAWWIPAQHSTSHTILFIHGNARNISYFCEYFKELHDHINVNIYAVSLRGYGKSSSVFSLNSVVADLQKAVATLKTNHQIENEHIILYGRSQGASIAAELAVQNPVRGLIIEAGLSSLDDAVKNLFKKSIIWYPFANVNLIGLKTKRFDTFENLKQIFCPVLLIHGMKDSRVPFACALKNYSANTNNKYLWAENAGHKGCSGDARYFPKIRTVFEI